MLLCVPLAIAVLLAQDTPAAALTRAQMLEDLAVLEAGVTSSWAYVDDKRALFGIDVPALVAELGARLPESATALEFGDDLRRLVASFSDGHGRVVSSLAQPIPRAWPIELVDAAEGVLVRRVHPSVADRIAVGERVVSVDGVPVEERIAEVAATTGASSPHGRRRSALVALRWNESSKVRLGLEGTGGESREVQLASLDRSWIVEDPPRREWLEQGVGYLRLPNFTVDDWQGWLESSGDAETKIEEWLGAAKTRLDEAFVELGPARALVLDLRGNGGGTDWLGIHLARHLLEPGFTYFTLVTRYSPAWVEVVAATGVDRAKIQSDGWSPPYPEKPKNEPRIEPWGGPLWILVDADCFSTCDNVVACLADQHPDVRVIGRATHGGTGGPRPVAQLPNSGFEVRVCLQQVRRPSGELIEGRGTTPDVVIEWTREDLVSERDPDLEAALEEVRATLAKRGAEDDR